VRSQKENKSNIKGAGRSNAPYLVAPRCHFFWVRPAERTYLDVKVLSRSSLPLKLTSAIVTESWTQQHLLLNQEHLTPVLQELSPIEHIFFSR